MIPIMNLCKLGYHQHVSLDVRTRKCPDDPKYYRIYVLRETCLTCYATRELFTYRASKNLQQAAKRRVRLFVKQRGMCAYCDRTFDNPLEGTLDHVVPKSKGGGNGDNLVFCCKECNRLKAAYASRAEVREYTQKLNDFFDNLNRRGYIQ